MVRIACWVSLVLAGLPGPSLRAAEDRWQVLDGEVRFVSLAEVIAATLEEGTVGQPSLLFPGIFLDCKADESSMGSVKVLVSRTAAQPNDLLLISSRWNRPRPEWERNVNQVLLNVETAYWNLYGGYWQLHSREAALRLAYETWKTVGEQYRNGKASLADFAQAQGQYELFRAQRLQALNQVLDYERQLRGIMNLPGSDGTRLVPGDAPSLVLEEPDWKASLTEALANRPELQRARQEVKWCQLRVLLVRGLKFVAERGLDCGVSAPLCGWLIGHPIDKATASKLCEEIGPGECAVRLRQPRPVVYREAYASLRQAQLKLARAYLVLQDQELKVERFLGLEYRTLGLQYEQIKANRAQREAFATQLKTRYQQYLACRGTLDILLEAQRFWADALAQEYAAIVAYNNARCAFAFAKGSGRQHAHVTVLAEPPAGCELVRAVEYERERMAAEMNRERAKKVMGMVLTAGDKEDCDQASAASTLPALWQGCKPLTEVPPLPAPDGKTVGQVELKDADLCSPR
jgi:hypothetical protein